MAAIHVASNARGNQLEQFASDLDELCGDATAPDNVCVVVHGGRSPCVYAQLIVVVACSIIGDDALQM